MLKFIKSFQWAMSGIRTVWREEVNFRIEVGIAVLVIAVGVWLRFLPLEWILIVGCIVAVLSAEIINTAVEDLCDRIEPAHDPIIGKIKDVMAGFVFVVSLGAIIVGMIVFVDYFSV